MAVRDLLAEGMAHHNAGRFAEAEGLYRRALDLAGDNFDALLLLGSALNAQGRPGAAEPFLKKAVALAPDNVDATLLLAMVLGRQDKHAEAAEAYVRGLSLTAHAGADMYLACARHQVEAKDLAGASETLGTLVLRAPDNVEAHFQYGRVAEQGGATDIALEAFRRVVALEPGAAHGYAYLGRTQSRALRFKEAIANLEKAASLAPNDCMVYCALGHARQYSGDMEGALDDYARALTLNRAVALRHILRAISLAPTGQLWLHPDALIRELEKRAPGSTS